MVNVSVYHARTRIAQIIECHAFFCTRYFYLRHPLSVAGIATLRMTSRPADVPFATVTLLFGIQQISEGMLWLSFENDTLLSNTTLTLVFSPFSHVLWPIFMPLAVGLLEIVAWRRKVLAICQIAGVMVGLYLLYLLVQFPATSRVLGKHIVYESPHFYIVTVMVF